MALSMKGKDYKKCAIENDDEYSMALSMKGKDYKKCAIENDDEYSMALSMKGKDYKKCAIENDDEYSMALSMKGKDYKKCAIENDDEYSMALSMKGKDYKKCAIETILKQFIICELLTIKAIFSIINIQFSSLYEQFLHFDLHKTARTMNLLPLLWLSDKMVLSSEKMSFVSEYTLLRTHFCLLSLKSHMIKRCGRCTSCDDVSDLRRLSKTAHFAYVTA
ncbi:hypothetical protein CHS0354_017747 [Potamilus streckersoni]|uniref:Uncharacterized protein n=1 Tax=Potamilus streckersoni TaxID=2493646 RepID=A0AAE0S3L2_9BIVA|nr:hypothetical protein CHS0354_017747 [Potamilus streckersoni]